MSKQVFSVIVADPPWKMSDKLSMSKVKRGAAANYSTMTLEEIKQLSIKNIADPNGCLLALWVPSSILQDGLDVMKAWGFAQKQSYVWVKQKKKPFAATSKSFMKLVKDCLKVGNYDALQYKEIKELFSQAIDKISLNDMMQFNMGRLFRNSHEICLIGTNNSKIYQQLQNKSQRTVSFASNLKHSAKPENLQDSLEIMFPQAFSQGKCLEMFARRQRPGWLCLGNEIGPHFEDITTSLERLI